METIRVLSEDERNRISHITKIVNHFLSKKTLFERRIQDENNRTTLGGVSFFYKFDKDQSGNVKNVTLVWDVHPKDWEDSLILEDIRTQEAYMDKAQETGEAFGSNPHYNPFRY